MRAITWVALAAIFLVALPVHGADICLVRGGSIYDGITENLLAASGIDYDPITEAEAAAEGVLTTYRMAIFPLNSQFRGKDLDRVVELVDGGGKLLYMSGIPSQLQEMLGIGEWESRGKAYAGEFAVMKFTDDRPAEFPAQVYQESPNSRIVHSTLDHAKVLAVWHDSTGKDLGFPAVIATEDTVWTAHVFWGGANVDQQRHLLTATVAYLLPDTLPGLVAGIMSEALATGGYQNLDDLVAAARDYPRARPIARRARANAGAIDKALASETPGVALALASEVRADIQTAAAAIFPSRPYELRGAWMHPDDAFDYEAVMAELAAANFNAVFPIVCGPNYTKYPSDYAPQYTERDHVRECIDAARPHGIEVHLWKANWQASGSRNPELLAQMVADGRAVVSVEMARGEDEVSRYKWSGLWLDPSDERNRQLEFDMEMELIDKYHPDGIHYDFMRYPESRYCFCDRCHTKFQEWADVTVENWPDDCYAAGVLADCYRDWRRHLMTSMVERIAEGARERDPDIKISLAARASMTGSFDSDAQDWVTWAHERHLDLLCPMDYTNSLQVLYDKVKPQVEAVDGAIPVYAGLGVSPGRSDSPVNLSQQITLARELGADGFLLFALSPFARAMLPALALGATSTPVTVMPHHDQSATASFAYPPVQEGLPPRTYGPHQELPVTITVNAAVRGIEQLTVQALSMPAGGGKATALTKYRSTEEAQTELAVTVQSQPGSWSVIVQGEVVYRDGHEEPFYLRSLPLRVSDQQQYDDLMARTGPPVFHTDGLHVGVVVDCYGTEGVLVALRATEGIEALPIAQLTAEYLSPCDVLVLPQPQENPKRVNPESVQVMRDYVADGGGLLAMRDVIGAWIYSPLIPEVAAGDGTVVKVQRVAATLDHPVTAGLTVGEFVAHAFGDHLPLAVGEAATVVMQDPEGKPVVACGDVGEGRYVACGFAIGRTPTSTDAVPEGVDRDLLINFVQWLAQ